MYEQMVTDLTTCEYDVHMPGRILTSSDYRRMADEKQTCTWHIQAPESHHIQVSFPIIRLAPPDYLLHVGAHLAFLFRLE